MTQILSCIFSRSMFLNLTRTFTPKVKLQKSNFHIPWNHVTKFDLQNGFSTRNLPKRAPKPRNSVTFRNRILRFAWKQNKSPVKIHQRKRRPRKSKGVGIKADERPLLMYLGSNSHWKKGERGRKGERREVRGKLYARSREIRGFVPSYYPPPQPLWYYYISSSAAPTSGASGDVHARRLGEPPQPRQLIVFILLNHFPTLPRNFPNVTRIRLKTFSKPSPLASPSIVLRRATRNKLKSIAVFPRDRNKLYQTLDKKRRKEQTPTAPVTFDDRFIFLICFRKLGRE